MIPDWAEGLSLAAVKARLKRDVDDAAENTRLHYITPGFGMMLTYQEKFAQAQAVGGMGEAAANALSAEDAEQQFPTLMASVGIEAETLWGCAQLVLQRYAGFALLSNGIERARLSAKKSISDASDVETAFAVYEALTWPTP